jgi:hypothetical protein
MGAGAGRWIGVAAFGLLLAALPAFAAEPNEDKAREPSAVLVRPLAPAAAAAAGLPRVKSLRSGFAEAGPGVSVVELPPHGVQLGPQQRRHHAISFATEQPRRLLRSLGLEATDCSTQFRFPSRLRQSKEGIKYEVQGQVRFVCNF